MSENRPSILVIEDEAPIRRFLRAYLEAQGYRFLEAETGMEGISLAASHGPDAILLDLGLPDLDGLAVIKRLREWSATPIVILSARGQERDKIEALDAGADDYLSKPFGVGELGARLRVCLRRGPKADEAEAPVLQCGELVIDLAGHNVTVAGQEAHLTPLEFKLLGLLARHAGKVLTHRHILREVWGPGAGESQAQVLRIHIHALRHKLEKDPARPAHIRTETGVGYRLVCGKD